MAELSLATWNVAVEGQGQRVDAIAEHLAGHEPGITILTELTAVTAFRKALAREIGPQHSFASVATASPYADAIGILITGRESELLEDPKTIDTGGWKMPYFMKAVLSTHLGEMSVAALRGAYVYGKGGWLTTGRRERAVQYQRAVEVLEDDSDIAIIGGDMNSQPSERDHIFKGAGYELLTGHRDTWPDPQGIGLTNWRARMLARPFLLTGGVALDAFYGRGPIEGDEPEAVATGLSDHLYLGTTIRPASDTIE